MVNPEGDRLHVAPHPRPTSKKSSPAYQTSSTANRFADRDGKGHRHDNRAERGSRTDRHDLSGWSPTAIADPPATRQARASPHRLNARDTSLDRYDRPPRGSASRGPSGADLGPRDMSRQSRKPAEIGGRLNLVDRWENGFKPHTIALGGGKPGPTPILGHDRPFLQIARNPGRGSPSQASSLSVRALLVTSPSRISAARAAVVRRRRCYQICRPSRTRGRCRFASPGDRPGRG